MPAATTSILAGASAAASLGQAASGIIGTKKAKRDINNFDYHALTNVYKDMPISLLGSNLAIEENSRNNATYVDAARGGGIRGILGALPAIQSGTNTANRQAQLDLDNQVQRRNYAIAGDEQRIQGMQEQRDNQELAGIGQRLDANRQDTWSGIRGFASAFQYDQINKQDQIGKDGQDAAQSPNIFKRIYQVSNDTIQPITTIQPIGTVPNLNGSLMPSYMSTLKLQDDKAKLDEASPNYW